MKKKNVNVQCKTVKFKNFTWIESRVMGVFCKERTRPRGDIRRHSYVKKKGQLYCGGRFIYINGTQLHQTFGKHDSV